MRTVLCDFPFQPHIHYTTADFQDPCIPYLRAGVCRIAAAPAKISKMSSHSRSGSRTALPPLPAETVQLFSSTSEREELVICCSSDAFLKITKKIYHNGPTNPHLDTWRLDLTKDAVLLLYTINDKTDVTARWQIEAIYGAESKDFDSIDYELLSEQDVFTFQQLVTGYWPSWRLSNVSASALEQHKIRQATEIDSVGEIQLWSWSQQHAPLDESPLPLTPATTRSSTENRSISGSGSVLSAQYAPSVHVRKASVYTDLKGRELSVTMAEPPPLLVLFGKAATLNSRDKPYHMWRVDSEFSPLL